MTLRDYVLAFARHWIIVTIAIVVGLVTAGITAALTPPTYRGSAQVLFTGRDPSSGQDQAYIGGYVQARMGTYGKLVSSTEMLTAASKKIGAGETEEHLRSQTRIDVSEQDTVATIEVTDESARRAARSADAVAVAFLDEVARLEPDFSIQRPDGEGARSNGVTITGTVTRKAIVPRSPIAPMLSLYLLAGALGGLFVSVGVIVYREAWRSGGTRSSGAGGH